MWDTIRSSSSSSADVVRLYPSISCTEGLEVLCEQYKKFLYKKVPTKDIVKMVHFVLKSNFFEFNSKFFKIAIATKFSHAPACALFFSLHWTRVWKRFIGDGFFI